MEEKIREGFPESEGKAMRDFGQFALRCGAVFFGLLLVIASSPMRAVGAFSNTPDPNTFTTDG